MVDKLTVVYRTAESHKAHLLKRIFDDYEVRCQVADRAVSIDVAPRQEAISVFVDHSDLELATRIVEAFDRHLATQWTDEGLEEEASDWELPRIWAHWPQCKRCGRVRETACPYCQTVGSNFELADQEWTHEAGEVAHHGEPWPLLLCHTCSEPFEPEFIRHCAHCSLDLGDGSPAPHVELLPQLGFYSPAAFGWLLIVIAVVILLMMMSRT